jgi:hypothetical protein
MPAKPDGLRDSKQRSQSPRSRSARCARGVAVIAPIILTACQPAVLDPQGIIGIAEKTRSSRLLSPHHDQPRQHQQRHDACLRRADRFHADRRLALDHGAPEPKHDAHGSDHADAALTSTAWLFRVDRLRAMSRRRFAQSDSGGSNPVQAARS